MHMILIQDLFLQSGVRAEVEQLRKEVQTTLSMYKQACEELVHKQTQVGVLEENFFCSRNPFLMFLHLMDS